MKRLIAFLLCMASILSWAREEVRVGAYSFPPFVSRIVDNRVEGVSARLLDALNRVQDRYAFRFVPTSSKRRYRDFDRGRFDVMLFESPQWGWHGRPVQASRVFLTGGEVYVARKAPGRDQSFFDSLDDKRIVAILGYHYGFADYVSDENVLHARFNIFLTTSHMGSLRTVLLSEPEQKTVAVVTRAYLHHFLRDHPSHRHTLLISERLDQVYQHRILLREGGPVAVQQVNSWLNKLEEQGFFDTLRGAYGLQ